MWSYSYKQPDFIICKVLDVGTQQTDEVFVNKATIVHFRKSPNYDNQTIMVLLNGDTLIIDQDVDDILHLLGLKRKDNQQIEHDTPVQM